MKALLPANWDARLVALIRGVVSAAIIAAIAAAQQALADPSWEGYGWVPIAVYILRQVEGFLDNADPERPG